MASQVSPKYSNIARPYARAAFEYAKSKKHLSEWKVFLEAASELAALPQMIKLLTNPDLASEKLFNLFHETLIPLMDTAHRHFLLLLTENRRLLLLPEITGLFNAYYAALEKTGHVRVITATKIEEDVRQTLAQALTKRIHHSVTLHCEVDADILGGAIIHIGDRVIDGSIRGKLTRLLEFSLR